mmetsp:Transcript_53173/g.140570  ORF Transcript_53173/g.140570 Transcript_53173/m.140570 type:complete len:221 (-) Transcript_53173:2252-2914(-)
MGLRVPPAHPIYLSIYLSIHVTTIVCYRLRVPPAPGISLSLSLFSRRHRRRAPALPPAGASLCALAVLRPGPARDDGQRPGNGQHPAQRPAGPLPRHLRLFERDRAAALRLRAAVQPGQDLARRCPLEGGGGRSPTTRGEGRGGVEGACARQAAGAGPADVEAGLPSGAYGGGPSCWGCRLREGEAWPAVSRRVHRNRVWMLSGLVRRRQHLCSAPGRVP